MSLRQGDIYTSLDGPPFHPAVVISRDELNGGKYVLTIPFTSVRVAERAKMANYVRFRAGEAGLEKACVAQADAVTMTTIMEELDIGAGRVGHVRPAKLRELIKALGYSIRADCEPI